MKSLEYEEHAVRVERAPRVGILLALGHCYRCARDPLLAVVIHAANVHLELGCEDAVRPKVPQE